VHAELSCLIATFVLFLVFFLCAQVEEGYDTRQYTAKQKASGRIVLFQVLERLLSKSVGLLFLDTNKLILDNDINFRKSTHHVLYAFGFRLALVVHNDEMKVYNHLDTRHCVLVHKPLCRASDPQSHVTEEERDKRGLSIAILGNVMRELEQLPCYTIHDLVQNPIYAMVAQKIVKNGYSQDNRECSAFFREFMSPSHQNPLTENSLMKTAADDTAVSRRVRRQHRLEERRQEEQDVVFIESTRKQSKVVESDLYIRLRSIISMVEDKPTEERLQQVYDDLDNLISTNEVGDKIPLADQSSRWIGLFKYIRPNTNLWNDLKTVRAANVDNKGNQNS
jgi:hypothetical protein